MAGDMMARTQAFVREVLEKVFKQRTSDEQVRTVAAKIMAGMPQYAAGGGQNRQATAEERAHFEGQLRRDGVIP